MKNVYVGLTDIVRKKDALEHPEDNRMVIYTDCTYSVEYDSIVHRPVSSITVCSEWEETKCHEVKALWDTGSTQSCISKRLAEKLKAHEIGTRVNILPAGTCDSKTYNVTIKISEDLIFNDMLVVEYPLENHDVDFLIGMDVIARGDFSIRNVGGKTKLSFTMK